jgi:predicted transcriptional regulator
MKQLPFLFLSIRRIYAERIFSKRKHFELRKNLPIDKFGKVFLHESGAGKIIGYFEPGEPIRKPIKDLWAAVGENATSKERFFHYFGRAKNGCAIPVLSARKFTHPLDTKRMKRGPRFQPPLSWLLVKPDSKLHAVLSRKVRRDTLPPSVNLYPISQRDRELYVSLVTSEISPKYDDITEDFARANLRTHQLGKDPNGIFTIRKQVLAIKVNGGKRIGFTTLTYKIGGCVKTGPTILLRRHRGRGYGLAARQAIESLVRRRQIRKLYCTCPDNDPKVFSHLIRAGFSVEAHLKNHYSGSHGEFVLGKLLDKNNVPNQLRFHRPKSVGVRKYTRSLTTSSASAFLKQALRSYWCIDSSDLTRTILKSAADGKSKYEQKPVDLLFFRQGRKTIGASVFVPKRGGSVKVLWFPVSDKKYFDYMIRSIESYARKIQRRKIFFVHPYDDIEAILQLKSSKYQIEGILKEPYCVGRDAIIASRLIA